MRLTGSVIAPYERSLCDQGYSLTPGKQIAAACDVSRTTVSEYLRRTAEAGLIWMRPARLEQLLFPAHQTCQLRPGAYRTGKIQDEFRSKNVTLFLLCQEYREANPDGYQYSWFCEHYRAWRENWTW